MVSVKVESNSSSSAAVAGALPVTSASAQVDGPWIWAAVTDEVVVPSVAVYVNESLIAETPQLGPGV